MKIDSEALRRARIDETAGVSSANEKPKPAQSGVPRLGSAATVHGGIGSIRISDASRALQSVGSTDAAAAPFDAARVEAIKTAISEGRFTVNAEAVADSLLASVGALLGPRA